MIQEPVLKCETQPNSEVPPFLLFANSQTTFYIFITCFWQSFFGFNQQQTGNHKKEVAEQHGQLKEQLEQTSTKQEEDSKGAVDSKGAIADFGERVMVIYHGAQAVVNGVGGAFLILCDSPPDVFSLFFSFPCSHLHHSAKNNLQNELTNKMEELFFIYFNKCVSRSNKAYYRRNTDKCNDPSIINGRRDG